ncbi:MAG: serine/threonine protein kinase, partial [Kofleriaceae bacterium]|nr:serine/threonine protein kinase [Kofleriaceae bacterium]
MTAAVSVRCPTCGAAIALAVGDSRLACAACGLAAPVSRVGTAPGVALVALEPDLGGATLGGYQLGERIGAGGMGTVYRARGTGGDVAIKVLRPGLGVDRAAALARFAREAAALRRLYHPNVVRFLDHGQEGDVAYLVTELVDGRDLAQRLAAGPLPLAEIVDVMGQVCDGVAAAHAAGIVHRDLKPANILVGPAGVKVADFGLAQLGPDAAVTTLTRTDVAMGTFHYLAPEQRKDARTVDHRADIWALGVILYELVTGELPLGSFPPPTDRRIAAIVRRRALALAAAALMVVAGAAGAVVALGGGGGRGH